MNPSNANVEPAHLSPKKEILSVSGAAVFLIAAPSVGADVDLIEDVASQKEVAEHQSFTLAQDTLHETISDDEVEFAGVKPTEVHYHRQLWLEALGGSITDVEANGRCGWSALFAATHNIHEEFLLLTSKQVVEATLIKKKVLNVLLAKRQYLVDTRAIDIKTEPVATYSGAQETATEPTIDNHAL
ncbi:hypothetical protein PHMEG_00016097 [Phytophthora megakarya]|uniref:Uncharacterized protein n=1 Tax=Phytophthora megakarya TaxID=4795 RepID=A0A225VZM4_9STRA|nr:hypothetical protein PHMEG_00016097 [Phytophthora megakarya]